jgi:uncharacterized membrane protein YhaH (DUF805 family)
MSIREILFSFKGRLARRGYWTFVAFIAPLFLIGGIIDHYRGYRPFEGPLISVLSIVLLWPSLAVQVKRWHDRNKSGWWVLINVIPFIGAIWSFVENACLVGTGGPNDYGEDPLVRAPNQRLERP